MMIDMSFTGSFNGTACLAKFNTPKRQRPMKNAVNFGVATAGPMKVPVNNRTLLF